MSDEQRREYLASKVANFVRWLVSDVLSSEYTSPDHHTLTEYIMRNSGSISSAVAGAAQDPKVLLEMLRRHAQHPLFSDFLDKDIIEEILLVCLENKEVNERFFRYLFFFGGQWRTCELE